MAEQDALSRPIQVFLNTGQFISLRENRQRGGNRDFFEGDNLGFSRHKSRMRQKLQDAAATLRRDSQSAAFVIVQMREEALAKSYRPLNALFSPTNSFRLVGGGGIGEIFLQCTPAALDRLDSRIEARAELEPRIVENERTGELETRPSTCRSELGGIEDIRLPTPADRVTFSAHEATEWLDRPDTLGGYLVELFRPDSRLEPNAVAEMIDGFRRRLVRMGGIVALPVFSSRQLASRRGHLAISVHLIRNREQSFIALPLADPEPVLQAWRRSEQSLHVPDFSVERHQHFLESGRIRVEWNQSLVFPSLWLNSDGGTRCGPRPLDPNMSARGCAMQAILPRRSGA